jgi:lysyl-tRNA synthetase class 2
MSEEPPAAAPEEEITEHQLIHFRRQKLDTLRKLGVDPFGGKFATSHQPGALRDHFEEEIEVRVAGRIVAHRDMGKSQFFDIADINGRLQCFLNPKSVGDEAFEVFQQLDIGDWIGVEGTTFITRMGEPTVRASAITVLSKSLRPLPDKWHGVVDPQIKYRQRYLDLIANERTREAFLKRSAMVAEIRAFLAERDFIEVETPMLQDVPGGAAAEPFKTHHNALGMDLFMRIAPELFLKRLLVGGFTKVFELNRNFRNEGISRRHNPEFTMLEAYWAFADFEQMANLVEEMICHLAEKFCGGLQIEHKNANDEPIRTINLSRPWKRAAYHDLVKEAAGDDWFDITPGQRRKRCDEELGVEVSDEMEDYEVSQQVFEKLVEEKTFDPCYVTHVPRELVPLAKQNADNKAVVDVYELIINGQEISPGYSELNDPDAQRQRLEHQAGGETQKLDEDFLLALEYGMPPAGGIGLGIDRLVMMLTGAESIRDIVLFPQLRRSVEG